MKQIFFFILLVLLPPVLLSDEESDTKEPKELLQAREAYKNQIKASTYPITLKYLQQLETLKKQLGGRGDIAGASTVQKEIDSMDSSKSPDKEQEKEKSIQAGSWRATYSLGNVRIYEFKENGKFSFTCIPKEYPGNTGSSRLVKEGGREYFLLEFTNDQKIEKWVRQKNGFSVEHLANKDSSIPLATGLAKKELTEDIKAPKFK